MTRELEMWRGEFGDEYTERNMPTEQNINQRKIFWAGLFSTMQIDRPNKPKSILEVGANVGGNLIALDELYKSHGEEMDFYAVEPNKKARNSLTMQGIRSLKIIDEDAKKINAPSGSVDIVFTCGVLIHINPNDLMYAMAEIYRVSRRFIICAEYFSPEPRPVLYRGEKELLWARDFGEEWVTKFPALRCVSYSFAWKRFTGMDNLTWFVLEKVS